jgi:hypothetical protein
VATNPFANKWVADFWGRTPRNDWVSVGGGKWDISGSSPGGEGYGGPVFDDRAAAQAYLDANPRSGPTDSQMAYSASLAAQGIPESELPYGSGQLRTFAAQAGRGLPIADYLQAWARTSPGAFGQIGNRMYANSPRANISKLIGGREQDSDDSRRAALIKYLMSMYGGNKTQLPD